MPKSRLTSLDILALSTELQSIVQLRLQNIYDINSRTFLLKFGLPDIKRNVIVESGFRLHLTTYSREKSSSPSHFVAKLRKFLKTRRLTRLYQIGTDRILVMSFTNEVNDEKSYHLIFEFFSAGNILLVSSDYKILHVLRTFRPTIPPGGDPSQFQFYEIGAHYRMLEDYIKSPTQFTKMTFDRLHSLVKPSENGQELENVAEEEETNALMPQGNQEKKKSNKQKKKDSKNTLRKVLTNKLSEYGAQLVDEVVQRSGIDGSMPINQISQQDENPIVEGLLQGFKWADEMIENRQFKGYITTKTTPSSPEPVYDEFIPFKPTSLQKTLEYDTFNLALDAFFTESEQSRLVTKHTQAVSSATTRLEAFKNEHFSRLSSLRQVQDTHILKARLIEANLERVEEAIRSVNGLRRGGMDWGDIERIVDAERKRGNVVAEIILRCLFKEGKMIIGLREEVEDEEEDDRDEDAEEDDDDTVVEGEGKLVEIEIDLDATAWGNAQEYFNQKKVAAEKESRTAQSSSKALKNAERKITADLKKNLKEEKPLMKSIRETKWFEKFYWFISSEGYLIIGARDALQTELLIRKYFRKGDVYVHSDLEHSTVVIIKNPSERGVIPPGTLSQAGIMAIATSRAWEVKQVTSAWWVPYEQVHRTEGGHDVRGKKNYLPPAMLVLGYGVLWFTEDEDTMERHVRPLLFEAASEETLEEAIPEDDILAEQVVDGTGEVKDANEEDVDVLPAAGEEDKYNLHEYGSASDEEAPEEQSKPEPEEATTSSKRYLSAKQRRDLRKGKSVNQEDESEDSEVDEVASSITNLSVSKQKTIPQVRGKRGKMKKMKAKYADQSDEERELARRLLGDKSEKVKAVDDNPVPQPKPDVVKAEKKAAPTPTPRPPRQIEDEPLEELDLSLKEFIASPKADDILSDAVPICAPWSALSRCKYKVKLIPGAVKKGKAARSIIGGFLSLPVDNVGEDPEKMSGREKELLESLKDEDIIPCIWPKAVKVVGGKSPSEATTSAKGGKKPGPTKGKLKK